MNKDFSIQKILSIFLQHIKLIVIMSLVTTVVAFCYTKFYITPTYSTSAILLVQNFDNSESATEPTTSSGTQRVWVSDLSSSATLADYCTVLFQNSPEMLSVLDGCGLSIESENKTNFLRFTIYGSDPQQVYEVAEKVTETAPKIYLETYKIGKIDTIRPPYVPTSPSAPNLRNNVVIGFLAGLLGAMLISLFLYIIDTTIKPDDDLFKTYGIPVFAEVVDFEREEKGK